MIDYAVVNNDAIQDIEGFKVLEEAGSDHLTIRMEWKERNLEKVKN